MTNPIDFDELDEFDVPDPGPARPRTSSLDILLRELLAEGGSDLHLAYGSPPRSRVKGALTPMSGRHADVMNDDFLHRAVFETILGGRDADADRLRATNELDVSYLLDGTSRFRVNVHRDNGHYGLVIRVIPLEVPRFDTLGLPDVLQTLCSLPRGLVLVTGPTGSGKTTTLASMIDLINRRSEHKIVTIEDPIEFVHTSRRSLITHREVGADTASFTEGVKRAMRQDPDVILLGELRDSETAVEAMRAAETGHLVFATLHTSSVAQTVDRLAGLFPETQQDAARTAASASIAAIVCQTLCRSADGTSRVVAAEVLVMNDAARTSVRKNELQNIENTIQGTRSEGNVLLDQALTELVAAGRITQETAFEKCHSREDLARRLASSSTDFRPGASSSTQY